MFTQSAFVLLNEIVLTEQILAALHDQDFLVTLHKQGNDLLTRAVASDVCEVVIQTKQRASVLIDGMNTTWPDKIPNDKEDPVTFLSWHAAAFGAFAYPGCLARAVQECRTWPGAKKAVERHRALLRVRFSYEKEQESRDASEAYPPLEELVHITRLLLALDWLPGVLGYFFPGGEALCSSELLHATWEAFERRGWKPFDLWIMWINRRLGHTAEAPDWAVIDTIGMWQLAVTDIEAFFQPARYQPLQVANWLANVASYLYDNGPIIEEGQTVTGPGGKNWQAYRFESSVQYPPRPVLCLRPLDGSIIPPRLLKRIPVLPRKTPQI